MPRIIVLTGAGISAESGLGTFRDQGGLWRQYDLEDVATPEGFARNPSLVQSFYNARRRNAVDAQPNAAHRALAELEAAIGEDLFLVTQNIDDLHRRAGSQRVLHMHGELLRARCAQCGHKQAQRDDLSHVERCGACGAVGGLRPDVVWFGEAPIGLDRIAAAMAEAETFVSIGTSGQVYPAAGFVMEARALGMRTVELNLEATSDAFISRKLGPATEIVPAWVREVLGE